MCQTAVDEDEIMFVRRSALAVVLMLVLAGCDSSSGHGPAAHPLQVRSSAPQVAGDSVKDLAALKAQADEAMQKVATKCMEAMGFTIFPADPQTGPIPQQIPDSYQPRVTDASARDKGYGIGDSIAYPTTDPDPTSDDPFSRLSQADRDRYNKAWNGNAWPQQITLPDGSHAGLPVGGCLKKAMQQVYGDLVNYLQLSTISDNDENVAIDEADSNPQVKAARQAWAACMDQAGYSGLGEPDDAYQLAQSYYAVRGTTPTYSDAARAKEIKLAAADAACVDRTNVDRVLWQVQVKALNVYRKTHDAQLVAYRQLLEQALTKAQQLLGGK